MNTCPICSSKEIIVKKNNLIYSIECKECGKYKISDPSLKSLILSELTRSAIKWFLGFNENVFLSNDYNNFDSTPIDYIIQEYKKSKQI